MYIRWFNLSQDEQKALDTLCTEGGWVNPLRANLYQEAVKALIRYELAKENAVSNMPVLYSATDGGVAVWNSRRIDDITEIVEEEVIHYRLWGRFDEHLDMIFLCKGIDRSGNIWEWKRREHGYCTQYGGVHTYKRLEYDWQQISAEDGE